MSCGENGCGDGRECQSGLAGSAGASLNEPPELQQLALNFLATF